MHIIKQQRVFVCSILIVLASFFWTLDVFALGVSPLRQSVVVDPGHEQIFSLDVTNDTAETVVIDGFVDAFVVDPESGAAHFDHVSDAEEWITPEFSSISIPSGDTASAPFVLDVPANAEPGSYYLSFFVEVISDGGQVAVEQQVGSLFFLDIAGEVKESLSKDFFSPRKQMYVVQPIEASLQLRNDGTYHVVPTGIVSVSNAFGKEVFKHEINSANKTVFADMRWQEKYRIEGLSWKDIGPLRVEMKINYGVTNQFLSDTFVVWYLPLRVVATIVGGVGFLLIVFILFSRSLRRKHS